MRKLVAYLGVFVFALTLSGKHSQAQIVNGAFKRTDIIQKKPMPLPTVREADVFWSQKLWRIIDLRETMVTIQGEMRPNDIKQYLIKEEWYFDKQNSTLNVRIIGICPIREFVRPGDSPDQVQRQKLFWIYYPEARPLLSTNIVLNPYNPAKQVSFDDLFIKRTFNSYIVSEENVYNNRSVSSYLVGKEAMLESKRIENRIFDYEQDLWEY